MEPTAHLAPPPNISPSNIHKYIRGRKERQRRKQEGEGKTQRRHLKTKPKKKTKKPVSRIPPRPCVQSEGSRAQVRRSQPEDDGGAARNGRDPRRRWARPRRQCNTMTRRNQRGSTGWMEAAGCRGWVVAVTERPDATRCGAGVAQGEGGRIVEAEKYENGGPPRGHDFSSRPYRPKNRKRECNTSEQATGATTSPITRSCDRTRRGEDFPTVQNA
jgi:hypothetical protein